MKRPRLGYQISMMGTAISLLLFCCVHTAAAQDTNAWQHELTIYGWYSGIDGTVVLPGPLGADSDFTVEADDILDNLSMIFMGGWASKKGKWSVIADVVYMDVGASANSVKLDLSSWIISGGVGYDLMQSDGGNLAVVGGLRYLTIEPEVHVGGQAVSKSEGLLDGIIGLRGSINFSENWYLPYYADIGTGGSDLSYNLFAGIGYRFGWGDIRLGYRYLGYEMDDDYVMADMALSGPVMGVGFRF